MKIKVIALDLEKTLISDALNCIPRPGLYDFLNFCCDRFERVVLFTAVYKELAEPIISSLVAQGHIPKRFLDKMEYIEWQGQFKNLQYVPQAGSFEILLIDDDERFIHPGPKSQWIPIKMFNPYFSEKDEELLRIRRLLEDRLGDDHPHGMKEYA